MCHFFSFKIQKIERDGDPLEIFALNPTSHTGIDDAFDLAPDQCREAEWTGDAPESLTVRVCFGEDQSIYRAAILADYPTRSALFAALGGLVDGYSYNSRTRVGTWCVENFKDGHLHGKRAFDPTP